MSTELSFAQRAALVSALLAENVEFSTVSVTFFQWLHCCGKIHYENDCHIEQSAQCTTPFYSRIVAEVTVIDECSSPNNINRSTTDTSFIFCEGRVNEQMFKLLPP